MQIYCDIWNEEACVLSIEKLNGLLVAMVVLYWFSVDICHDSSDNVRVILLWQVDC